ncbi:MAG: multicopper oxidase domain-containing protein [Rhodospirillales bacterium]|nr:multicopper oxidase domain-containing protein [Rhodospirillales bacterium]
MSEIFKRSLKRRQFLQLTSSTAIGAVLGSTTYLGFAQTSQAAGNPWILKVTRGVDDKNKFFYNGKTPGPTITASAAETIELTLINDMEPDNEECPRDINTPHGENITNFHTHGLHVSPELDKTGRFDADNVFLKVIPLGQKECGNIDDIRRGENKYRFDLPRDHTPGTHWYHAHNHGSTDKQVSGGLVGAIIIKDPPGSDMPDYITEAPERVIIISNGKAIEVDPEGGGQSDHVIKLAPGAVERWRIINADPRANSFLELNVDSPDVELWQIAYDGLTLEKRVRILSDNREPWLAAAALAPGNRTDLMVRVKNNAAAGRVALVAGQIRATLLRMPGQESLARASAPVEVRIEIEGDPISRPWSDNPELPGPGLPPIPRETQTKRTVTFSVEPDSTNPNGYRFMINGKLFGEDPDPMFKMKLGDWETWHLENKDTGIHPFHIHVNPFFVTHINGKELAKDDPLRRWQDVIAIPPQADGSPGNIDIVSHFADFTGKFVIHCHILAHEDIGMMRVVEVIK